MDKLLLTTLLNLAMCVSTLLLVRWYVARKIGEILGLLKLIDEDATELRRRLRELEEKLVELSHDIDRRVERSVERYAELLAKYLELRTKRR